MECLQDRLLSIDKKLENVIQSRVMDCAEEKEAYVRFAKDFLAFLDLVDEKLRFHKVGAERSEMLQRIIDVVNGTSSVSDWCAYLKSAGRRSELPQAFGDKWRDGIDEIIEKTREILPQDSSMAEVDRISAKFNGKRFCEQLIVPSVGERYDETTMFARTVDTDDETPHFVDAVMKFGFCKSCGFDETMKAVVKVK